MTRSLGPWLLVAPLSCIGVLFAHRIGYAVTGTPEGELHGYLAHAPQLMLLLTVLSLLGATLVERGRRVALWPFPAVAVGSFVVQEHLERVAHTGSWPFLLDEPYFLVGLALQALVGAVAWLIGRLLVRRLGKRTGARPFPAEHPRTGLVLVGRRVFRPLAGAAGPRAPPLRTTTS